MSQTADDIMQVLQGWAETKQVIDAHQFLDAATKLTLLLGEESDKLFKMEQDCARMRVELVEGGMSVSGARARVEASDELRMARSQKAKLDRIMQTIMLAKHRARLADSEFRAQ